MFGYKVNYSINSVINIDSRILGTKIIFLLRTKKTDKESPKTVSVSGIFTDTR